jgi:hypothetical protein
MIRIHRVIEVGGWNRTLFSPVASLNALISNGILALILKGFKLFFGTARHLPDLTPHIHPAYSVIEEIVEGFVVDFRDGRLRGSVCNGKIGLEGATTAAIMD